MNVWMQRAALAFAITAAAVVLVGLMLGRTWKVEVQRTIAAPPVAIHAFVDDLRQWQHWAGWNNAIDPDLTHAYSGPERGVGATWTWSGPVMGHGRIRIDRSEPDAGVWLVEAIESETDNAKGSLTFEVTPEGTLVTWRDEGKLPPVIGGFFRKTVQEALRAHFETGLRELDTQVRATLPAEATGTAG